MGVFSRPLEVLREWTERDDGTLEGPALATEEASIDGHRVYIQSTAPNNPSDNDIWFDLP